MSERPLLNQDLRMEVSEPWELSDPPETPGRRATVKSIGGADSALGRDALLLEVTPELEYGGTVYWRFVATPRHSGSLATSLLDGGRVEANLHGMPRDFVAEDPLSLDWWRGGLGIVATLFLPGPAERP